SDQPISWCCIDRLSWQDFSGLGCGARTFAEKQCVGERLAGASPIADAGVMDHDSPCRRLRQQLRHSWRNLTVTGDGACPFKVFPELSRANAPSLKGDRRHLPNLYEAAVSTKR